MEKWPLDMDLVIKKYKPEFAVAYGSGVFAQRGYSAKDNPIVDFIFGVNSTHKWHQENLQEHPKDYSFFIRTLGSNFIDKIQNLGAKMYYNPSEFNGRRIKYGVISIDDLLKDLYHWEYLYAAGRLQKPTLMLQQNETIQKAMGVNLQHALNVALLLLPENFTTTELFCKITNLSYSGDVRMRYAENPNKIMNIVAKNEERMIRLYKTAIELKSSTLIQTGGNMFRHQKSEEEFLSIYKELPKNLKQQVGPLKSIENLPYQISEAIRLIVSRSSKAQVWKGLCTSNPSYSAQYSLDKLKKARKH